jgi:hypothetical protein
VLDVEQWAELRREHFVRGVSIKELMRRTGLARNTIRTALRSETPPGFRVSEEAHLTQREPTYALGSSPGRFVVCCKYGRSGLP